MVSYLIPIWAVLIGVVILDESVASTAFAGFALIIAGVWVVNGGGLWLAERVWGNGRAGTPRVAGGADDEKPAGQAAP
jgi:hypothetical protein